MASGDINSIFGGNVRRYRRDKKLSQEQLAEAIGRTFHTISNIERGTSSTKISTAEMIAQALGVALIDLFAEGPKVPGDTHRQAAVERFVSIARTSDRETLDAIMEAVEAVTKAAGRKGGS